MTTDPLSFGPTIRARFIGRPNRFLVRCEAAQLGTVEAFLPNPGRLGELLLPGVTLYVTPEGCSLRKTSYTVLAVERDGAPVFLHTHLTNHIARRLIEAGRIPGLEDARVVRAEVPVGHSRFDLLLRRGCQDLFAEVKSCTLFGNGVAMFPDAVTERGRRHILELAALRQRGIRSLVLFLVHTPHVQWFMPDYHTDLAFSQTLLSVRKRVEILPVAVRWSENLSLGRDVKVLDIPWDYLCREVVDRGSYLLLLELKRRREVEIGGLGRLAFEKGFYLYVGSAMRNLSARIARHLRRRKTLRWHIDYLRQVADDVLALPVRSSRREECDVAHALRSLLTSGPAGFGSSDCMCPTHLFWSPSNPLQSRTFHAFLQRFRMKPPVFS